MLTDLLSSFARHVKTLVGEIDFSFRAITPSSIDADVESLGSQEGLKKDD